MKAIMYLCIDALIHNQHVGILQGNLVGVRKEPNKKWISLSGAALFGILLFLYYAEEMLAHIS